MEHRWNEIDRGKPKYSGKNLSQCHFVYHKCHMDWPGSNPGLRNFPLTIFHVHKTAILKFSFTSCKDKYLPPFSLAEVSIYVRGTCCNHRQGISIYRSQTTRTHMPDNFKSLLSCSQFHPETWRKKTPLTCTEPTVCLSVPALCSLLLCCLQVRTGERVAANSAAQFLCVSLTSTSSKRLPDDAYCVICVT
jgi:hypothetical protein